MAEHITVSFTNFSHTLSLWFKRSCISVRNNSNLPQYPSTSLSTHCPISPYIHSLSFHIKIHQSYSRASANNASPHPSSVALHHLSHCIPPLFHRNQTHHIISLQDPPPYHLPTRQKHKPTMRISNSLIAPFIRNTLTAQRRAPHAKANRKLLKMI